MGNGLSDLEIRVLGQEEFLQGFDIVNARTLDMGSYLRFGEMISYFSKIGVPISEVIDASYEFINPNIATLRADPCGLFELVTDIIGASIFCYCEEHNVETDPDVLIKYSNRAIAGAFVYSFLHTDHTGFDSFLDKYYQKHKA